MIRLLTYNIEFGGRGREEAILSVLKYASADIISLTEADDPDVVATLADELGMEKRWAEGSGDRHIATLSRFPIIRSEIYNRPPLTQAVLQTHHAVGDHELTVFNLHFLPFLLLPFEVRRWQAVGKLLRVIAHRHPGPHLLVGDVNAIAPRDRVLQRNNPARMRRVMALQLNLVFKLAIPRLLRAGYVDCFREKHPGEDGFTWMTGNPTTRYDYIFASPEVAPKLIRSGVLVDAPEVEKASDHYPLYADFEFGWV